MDRRIYKYLVETIDEQVIEIPKGSKILSIQNQQNVLRLWALVDTEQTELEDITIQIIATGKPLPESIDEANYFTTIEMCDGNLVWHIFIKKP